MNKFFYNLSVNILIFAFVVSLLKSVAFPVEIFYYIGTLLFIAILMISHEYLLRFLTVSNNFFTHWIAVSVLVGLGLYLLDTFAPGFHITNVQISPKTFTFITVNAVSLSKIATLVLTSAVTGLISGIIKLLKEAN